MRLRLRDERLPGARRAEADDLEVVGAAPTTSSACTPIEPVEPRMTRRRDTAPAVCRNRRAAPAAGVRSGPCAGLVESAVNSIRGDAVPRLRRAGAAARRATRRACDRHLRALRPRLGRRSPTSSWSRDHVASCAATAARASAGTSCAGSRAPSDPRAHDALRRPGRRTGCCCAPGTSSALLFDRGRPAQRPAPTAPRAPPMPLVVANHTLRARLGARRLRRRRRPR